MDVLPPAEVYAVAVPDGRLLVTDRNGVNVPNTPSAAVEVPKSCRSLALAVAPGAAPPDLSGLAALERLSLPYYGDAPRLPVLAAGGAGLRMLHVSFWAAAPASVSQCLPPGLRELELFNCAVASSPVAPQLQRLVMAGCQRNEAPALWCPFPPPSPGFEPQLEELELQSLPGPLPPGDSLPRSLRRLRIHGYGYGPMPSLAGLSRLESLDVADCSDSLEDWDSFTLPSRLQRLVVRGTSAIGQGLERALSNVECLRELRIPDAVVERVRTGGSALEVVEVPRGLVLVESRSELRRLSVRVWSEDDLLALAAGGPKLEFFELWVPDALAGAVDRVLRPRLAAGAPALRELVVRRQPLTLSEAMHTHNRR